MYLFNARMPLSVCIHCLVISSIRLLNFSWGSVCIHALLTLCYPYARQAFRLFLLSRISACDFSHQVTEYIWPFIINQIYFKSSEIFYFYFSFYRLFCGVYVPEP